MTDRWREQAEDAVDSLELALDQLKFVSEIVFDGKRAEQFEGAFWTLESLEHGLRKDLDAQ